jgi:hypothetical protein
MGELDTVFSLRKWIGNVSDDLIKKTLTTALATCNNILSSSPARLYYPVKQLYDSLENEFNYPVLKSNEPKKGIYRNYQDFLNNNPVEGDFDVKINKADISLSSNTIDTSVTKAAWGYCDGTDIYKHLNESYYKMDRVENTFELAGPRVIRQVHTKKEMFRRTVIDVALGDLHGGGIMLLMMVSDEKIMRELIPYQLNIKEGTFY